MENRKRILIISSIVICTVIVLAMLISFNVLAYGLDNIVGTEDVTVKMHTYSDIKIENLVVTNNEEVELPILEMRDDGAKFKGWFTDPSYSTEVKKMTTKNPNNDLYAKWDANTIINVKFGNVDDFCEYNGYTYECNLAVGMYEISHNNQSTNSSFFICTDNYIPNEGYEIVNKIIMPYDETMEIEIKPGYHIELCIGNDLHIVKKGVNDDYINDNKYILTSFPKQYIEKNYYEEWDGVAKFFDYFFMPIIIIIICIVLVNEPISKNAKKISSLIKANPNISVIEIQNQTHLPLDYVNKWYKKINKRKF